MPRRPSSTRLIGNTVVTGSSPHGYPEREAPCLPSDRNYVENVMWEKDDVLFVTVNRPGGSNNNDDDISYRAPTASPDQTLEVAQRTGADLRWLDAAFARAKAEKVKAIVIGAQADMWDPEKRAAHQALYEPFVKKIADSTIAFGKPVVMFNGDSHIYRSDNPLSPTAGCVGRSGCMRLSLPDPCCRQLQRAQLPPHRRSRQHRSNGMAEGDREPEGELPERR